MKHFFEMLEREIDYSEEYRKLEKMISFERHYVYDNFSTIDSLIESSFREWRKRQNFTSFAELRNHLDFGICNMFGNKEESLIRTNIVMEEYFLYCEMILNLIIDLHISSRSTQVSSAVKIIIDTMNYNIEKAGFEIKTVDNQKMIVEKNAVSIEVADIVPELADVIIEYNHYLLKGNLTRKQEILKRIADALEPKGKELIKINLKANDDFFYMVNNMNVRHNNCDSSDKKRFNPKFAALSDSDKEIWYDRIYDQALLLFVLLEVPERSDLINKFKRDVE